METEEGPLTIDALLLRMAQLNVRRGKLYGMRTKLPKERLTSTATWASMNKVPEYRYLNYDVEQVKNDYDMVNRKLISLQLVLDKFNQTHEFEIDG